MSVRAWSLSYHDVVPAGDVDSSGNRRNGAEIYKLDREDFCRQLAGIAAAPVGLCTGSWGACAPVFLTFDDGGASVLWIADELERRGWRGHFFIVTEWMGKTGFAGADEVRALARRGHVVGSHSATHPDRISILSQAELEREWRESIAILRDVTGGPVTSVSVPGGYYSRAVGEAAVKVGARYIFTSEPQSEVEQFGAALVLGRYSVKRGTSVEAVVSFAGGADSGPRRNQALLWKAKGIAKAVGGEVYLIVRRMLLRQHPPR